MLRDNLPRKMTSNEQMVVALWSSLIEITRDNTS